MTSQNRAEVCMCHNGWSVAYLQTKEPTTRSYHSPCPVKYVWSNQSFKLNGRRMTKTTLVGILDCATKVQIRWVQHTTHLLHSSESTVWDTWTELLSDIGYQFGVHERPYIHSQKVAQMSLSCHLLIGTDACFTKRDELFGLAYND